MTSGKIRIGMAQLLIEGGEPDRNLDRAEEYVRRAANEQCDIVLLPESMDCGWTHPSTFDECEPIPGPRTERLARLAAELGLFLCAGLTEQDNRKIYNAAVLFDDKGNLILKYRKINLLEVEQPFYEIGDRLGVVSTRFGQIGVNVCADNYGDSLEIGHVLARMGAQLILSPSSWTVDYSIDEDTDPYGDKWLGPLSTLAGLYNIAMVSTTSVGYIVGGPYEGKKMVGCSLAVGPNQILGQGKYNELASDLIIFDMEIPAPHEKGTQIGAMLKRKGFYPQ
jgi:predicted amidohydrolase